jgi:hypothetical protein
LPHASGGSHASRSRIEAESWPRNGAQVLVILSYVAASLGGHPPCSTFHCLRRWISARVPSPRSSPPSRPRRSAGSAPAVCPSPSSPRSSAWRRALFRA